MEKVIIVEHHGKGGHSEAAWNKYTKRSSVEKLVIAQQRGKVVIMEHYEKDRHSAAAWKK